MKKLKSKVKPETKMNAGIERPVLHFDLSEWISASFFGFCFALLFFLMRIVNLTETRHRQRNTLSYTVGSYVTMYTCTSIKITHLLESMLETKYNSHILH